MTPAPRGLFSSLTVACYNTNLYSCALAFSVSLGGEELAHALHALARALFVTHYSQRLSYPANETGRCLLNTAPGAVPDRYSLTVHPVCMLRLGGCGVSCGYSVTSCAIYLVDCVTAERVACACKRACLCHLLCRSFASQSSFLPHYLALSIYHQLPHLE